MYFHSSTSDSEYIPFKLLFIPAFFEVNVFHVYHKYIYEIFDVIFHIYISLMMVLYFHKVDKSPKYAISG